MSTDGAPLSPPVASERFHAGRTEASASFRVARPGKHVAVVAFERSVSRGEELDWELCTPSDRISGDGDAPSPGSPGDVERGTEDSGGASLPIRIAGRIELDDSEFENLAPGSSVAANAIPLGDLAPGSWGLSVRRAPGSGALIHGLGVRKPDALTGMVTSWGQSFHSESNIIKVGRDYIGVLVELGTNRYFLWRNGRVLGELFTRRADRDIVRQERYHSTGVIVRTSDGYTAVCCDHNRRIYMREASTPEGLVEAEDVRLFDGVYATYIRPAVFGNDVYFLMRAGTYANNKHAIIGFVLDAHGDRAVGFRCLAAPTGPARWQYPRVFRALRDDDGNPLLGAVVQSRAGTGPWSECSAAVVDPRKWTAWSIDGVDRTDGDGETAASPIIHQGRWLGEDAATSKGEGCQLLGFNPAGQRYLSDVPHVWIEQWNRATRIAGVVSTFADTGNTDPAAYQACDVRIMWHRGAVRRLSVPGADPVGLSPNNSYRIPVTFVEADSGDDLIVHYCRGGVRLAPLGCGQASKTMYYDLGGRHYRRRTWSAYRTDPKDSAGIIAALSDAQGATDLGSSAINIKHIPGGGELDVHLDIGAELGDDHETLQQGLIRSVSGNMEAASRSPGAGTAMG